MNFYQATVYAMRAKHYPDDYQISRIVQAKHFIDQSAPDNIDLDRIARHACLSKFHFIRLFKKYYCTTPHQYIIASRIQSAKQLLRTGESVAHTCALIGFSSISSFSGLFKKITGYTPGVYQRKGNFEERPCVISCELYASQNCNK
ncbi:MAG: AraC family transcriptional regulator [Chitinophagaceae bacterium]